MTTRRRGLPGDAWLRRGGGVLALAVLCASLTGCLVAGYSSRGGAFFWPGGLGGILLLVLLFLFLRGRR